MLKDRTPAGSGKDAETIGIDALVYLSGEPELMRRFLDLSGFEADQLRQQASKPGFFVGLLDFILAHEPTVMAFAAWDEIEPAEVGEAREKLARPA